MPMIDPFTGYKVMTLGEFAAEEGKTFEELMQLMREVREDQAEDEERWKQNVLSDLLHILGCAALRAKKEDPENDYPEPVEIIHQEVTHVHEGLRDSELRGWAIAKAADGKTYRYQFYEYHSSGSRWDPPEDEFDLEITPYG